MFPEQDEKRLTGGPINIGNLLLGNRIYRDQTVMEYLIEFLLVYCSAKSEEEKGSGIMRFHTQEELDRRDGLPYWVEPRIGLRRFIFYAQSKMDSKSPIDDSAYGEIVELVEAKLGKETVPYIHDLLYSYAAVTRKRGWYAKALLPVCPALVLTDAQGITARKRMKPISVCEDREDDIDRKFNFKQHNFLARGGQILYLHLLQPLLEKEKTDPKLRTKLESLLANMLSATGDAEFLATYVQDIWDQRKFEVKCEGNGILDEDEKISSGEMDDISRKHFERFTVGYITDAYKFRGERFLQEIITFLRADIHPIARIELLAEGLVLSLLRVIHIVAAKELDGSAQEPVWIIDVSGLRGTSNISRLASKSYKEAYGSFSSAMTHLYNRLGISEKNSNNKASLSDLLRKSWPDTCDLFKSLGKEIHLVIPPRGSYERFSLSEPLTRYLVLALVEPGQKVTYDTFLRRLYEHFGMVIGPEQFQDAVSSGRVNLNKSMAGYFKDNAEAFQDFIKQCGLSRDISDATSIVENPYQEVTIG